MAQTVTLEISDHAARRAEEVASQMRIRMEDVLAKWIDHAITEPPVQTMSDTEILSLCQLQMDEAQQEELTELLAQNQEGTLGESQRFRLDELMQVYRRGLVRKTQALNAAVARGLKPPLS